MKKILQICTTLLLMSTWLMVTASPASAFENPKTVIRISTKSTEVSAGDTINLRIVEKNKGDVRLKGVYVELYENDVLLETLYLEDDYWRRGDKDGDGDLDPGERWIWVVPVTVEADTTYMVIGYAMIAPSQFPADAVGGKGDPNEIDSIDVTVDGDDDDSDESESGSDSGSESGSDSGSESGSDSGSDSD